MDNPIKLSFGIIDPFLSTQLDKQGYAGKYDKDEMLRCESLRTSLRELQVVQLITDRVADNARIRLSDKIIAHIKKNIIQEERNG